MKRPIDLSDAMNPARYPALRQAQNRANREGKACAVYVAPPDALQIMTPTSYNVWYVRLETEPAPDGAELYRTVAPDTHQPKTGQACSCKPGQQRDNCPQCEGTGMRIDFAAIRNAKGGNK